MLFALIGSTVFLLAERIHRLDGEVRQRRLTEAEQARRETEARLKLLQAQIEPHFLFNTLANVSSLLDSDPPRARHLLDRLNDWLSLSPATARSRLPHPAPPSGAAW
jgi:sensor histidine kinase YesM